MYNQKYTIIYVHNDVYIYICSTTEIAGLSFQALFNHCFPSIRPSYKPLFLREVVRFRGHFDPKNPKLYDFGGVTFQPFAAPF